MKRRSLAVLLLAALLLLAACGKKEDAGPERTVYVPEQLEVSMDTAHPAVESACRMGDSFYLLCSGGSICRLPLEGGAAERLDYQPSALPEDALSDEVTALDLRPGGDGTLWVTERWDSIEDGNVEVHRQLDADGRELRCLDGIGIARELGAEWFMTALFSDGEGDIFACAGNKAAVLNGDGSVRFLLEGTPDTYIGNLALLDGGEVGVYLWQETESGAVYFLRTVDKAAENWGGSSFSLSRAEKFWPGSGAGSFYCQSGDSLYLFQEGAQAGEWVMGWVDSGLDALTVASVSPLDGGGLLVLRLEEGEAVLDALKPMDAAAMPERTELTMATGYLSSEMRQAVLDFNRTNDKYYITVLDYGPAITPGEQEALRKRINTEILSGNIPDILGNDCLFPERVARKGLLEDLWPYIENDPELGRDGVMERVLDACSVDGGLYYLPTSFSFVTVMSPRTVVGDRLGWTLEDMRSAMAAMPEDSVMFTSMWNGRELTRDVMLGNQLNINMDHFVDWSEGTCHFDSPEFRNLLDFCCLFPAEAGDFEAYWEEWENWRSRVLGGRQLALEVSLGSFKALMDYLPFFGGDMSFIGYPSLDGSPGSLFLDSYGPSVSAACKDKEGAWAFLRTLLLPKYANMSKNEYAMLSMQQNNKEMFPINKADFQWLAEYYMTPADQLSQAVVRSPVSVDGTEIEYEPLSQENYDQLMELYDSISRTTSWSKDVYNIVSDATGAYFAGDKGLEETVELVQSRVSLYVNEQK